MRHYLKLLSSLRQIGNLSYQKRGCSNWTPPFLLSDNREGIRTMFLKNIEPSLSKKSECPNEVVLFICRININAHGGTLSIDYKEKEFIQKLNFLIIDGII